jgi:hypothetical protein
LWFINLIICIFLFTFLTDKKLNDSDFCFELCVEKIYFLKEDLYCKSLSYFLFFSQRLAFRYCFTNWFFLTIYACWNISISAFQYMETCPSFIFLTNIKHYIYGCTIIYLTYALLMETGDFFPVFCYSSQCYKRYL